MKNLIDLQTSYVTQISGIEGKGDWVVYNEDKIEIYKLPGNMDEHQVMAAIHMGRKFELEAFNRGIFFQKSLVEKERKHWEEQAAALTEVNTKLASKLQQLMFKEQGDDSPVN